MNASFFGISNNTVFSTTFENVRDIVQYALTNALPPQALSVLASTEKERVQAVVAKVAAVGLIVFGSGSCLRSPVNALAGAALHLGFRYVNAMYPAQSQQWLETKLETTAQSLASLQIPSSFLLFFTALHPLQQAALAIFSVALVAYLVMKIEITPIACGYFFASLVCQQILKTPSIELAPLSVS